MVSAALYVPHYASRAWGAHFGTTAQRWCLDFFRFRDGEPAVRSRATSHLKGAPYAMLSMRRTTYPITAENSVSDAQFDPHAGRVAPSDALFGNAAAAAARGRPDSEAVALPRSLNDDRSEPQPEHQPNNLRR